MPTKKATASQKLAETLGASPRKDDHDGHTNSAPVEKVVHDKKTKKTTKAGVSEIAGMKGKEPPETRPASTEDALSPGQAQVVATLCGQGYSYQEAVAMLFGSPSHGRVPEPSKGKIDAATQKLIDGDDSGLPPIEDVVEKFDVVEVDLERRDEFRTLIDDLWTRREEMQDVPKKTKYRVTFDIDAPEWDWLLHRTIEEGKIRKDTEYSVQRAFMLLLKQQKALDPTRGGRRAMGGSGPKEGFNPQSGDWTKK